MAAPSGGARRGLRLFCRVCGAEVTVAHGGRGTLAPRCCNQPMTEAPLRAPIWHCLVCHREVIVARDGGGALALACCNTPMTRLG